MTTSSDQLHDSNSNSNLNHSSTSESSNLTSNFDLNISKIGVIPVPDNFSSKENDYISKSRLDFSESNYYLTIKSLCEENYFVNCYETLCNDFCNNNPNIINDDCEKKCSNTVNLIPPLPKNTVEISNKLNFIINKHSSYYNKYKSNPELADILVKKSGSSVRNYLKQNSANKNEKRIIELKDNVFNLKQEILQKEKEILKLMNEEVNS